MKTFGKKLSFGAKVGPWLPRTEPKETVNLGRSKKCDCGSGKKHKRCCYGKAKVS